MPRPCPVTRVASAAASVIAITTLACFVSAGAQATRDQQRTWTTAGGTVRIILNKPADFDPQRPTRLIIFATPNGNTAEQTLGAKLEPGMDWHYDIQHVAAQVRKLRTIDPSHNLVVACVQAANKSWPTWRKEHADNGKAIHVPEDRYVNNGSSCRVRFRRATR